MLKIYGIEKAPPLVSSAGRCFLLLEELGIEYEVVGLKFSEKEHKSEEYLKINPNGKIPTMIDDDGFVLWESMAINKYLARKYKPEILGKDNKEISLVEQWMTWGLTEYQTPLLGALRHGMMLPPEKRDPSVFETETKKLHQLHTILEKELENKEFLVGNSLTLADLHVVLGITGIFLVNLNLSEFPNLSKWVKNITNRPAFQKLQAQSKRPN
jgi:glutathione S-transferase